MKRYVFALLVAVLLPSSLDVEASMIKVIVTDPNAQNTDSYNLDLGAVKEGLQLILLTHPPQFPITQRYLL